MLNTPPPNQAGAIRGTSVSVKWRVFQPRKCGIITTKKGIINPVRIKPNILSLPDHVIREKLYAHTELERTTPAMESAVTTVLFQK